MKTASAVLCGESAAPVPVTLVRSRLADYVALTRPRIAVLVLFTVAIGAFLAAGRATDPLLVLHTVLGTALVAAGASALNQLLERQTDALMKRTESRPLPAGRIQPLEALLFGLALALVGTSYLALTLRQIWAPVLAAFTFLSYVGIYTPLKCRTTLNTLVGAVPGALPPVIGWTAMKDGLDVQAGSLFAILFLWQLPHFLAIAWIYRDDYARAGLHMVPVFDEDGRKTGRQMIGYTLALIAASFLPGMVGLAGPLYLLGSLALGLMFLIRTSDFARSPSTEEARRVLRASLLYLPGLFALLVLDAVVQH